MAGARKSKTLLRKLTISAGSLAFFLLVIEGLWRFWYTVDFGPTTNPHYVEHDSVLGWRYKPGAVVRHRSEDFNIEIRINSRGERDDEEAPSEIVKNERILLLGDSLAFGWGVPVEEGLERRLEQLLHREVRNLAVSGYSTDQELLKLQSAGLSLAPRDVVLVVCANDAEEAARGFVYGRRKPKFSIQNGELVIPRDEIAQSIFEKYSFFFRSIQKKAREGFDGPLSESDLRVGEQIVQKCIVKMGEALSARGARLFVVYAAIPWLDRRSEENANIIFCNMDAVLAAAAREGSIQFAHDPHWNSRGHAAVAAAVAARLAK